MPEQDLTTLTDDELAAHRIAVLVEIERRERRAQIPAQVADLAATYAAAGGDPADLAAAINGG